MAGPKESPLELMDADELKELHLKIHNTIKAHSSKPSTNRFRTHVLRASNIKNRRAPKKQETLLRHLKELIDFGNNYNLILFDENEPHFFKSTEIKSSTRDVRVRENIHSYEALTEELTTGHSKEIKILDTWMPYILDANQNLVETWAKSCDHLKILMIDPNSQLVNLRAKAFDQSQNEDVEKISQKILDCVKVISYTISNLKAEGYRGKIELRLYNQIPGMNTFISSNKIFYGSFLSFDYSKNTLFHSHSVTNEEDFISLQINKHFDRIWNSAQKIELSDIDQIENSIKNSDFEERQNRTYLISLLKEKYLLFSLDDKTAKNKFQQSILHINKENQTCELIIDDRESSLEVSYPGVIRSIGKSNLLVQIRKKNFYLSLLLFVEGGNSNKLLQGIYLHLNQNNHPISSICLIVDPENKKFAELSTNMPTRNDSNIDLNIQRFLIKNSKGKLSINASVSKPNDLIKNISNKNSILKKLEGKWQAFYPELYKQTTHHPEEKYYIGEAVLSIEQVELKEEFRCTFQTHEGLNLEGAAKVIKIQKKYFLKCSLRSKGDNAISLNFMMVFGSKSAEPNVLNGCYNIVYRGGYTIGCGFIVMVKSKPNDNPEPKKIDPSDQTLIDETEYSHIHHLVLEDNAALFWNKDVKENFKKIEKFKGSYKIYSCGRVKLKGGKLRGRCINIGKLEISKYGLVKLSWDEKDYVAGRISMQTGKNIFIELKNIAAQKTTFGYLIFKVKDKNNLKEGRLYCGIFTGLSIEDEQPLSKRTIIEYTGSEKVPFSPKKIYIHSPEFSELPEEIRETLTGRIPNYIGFQRLKRGIFSKEDLTEYNNKIVDMAKVFLDAAIYECQISEHERDDELALKNLERAIFHGFSDLSHFEEAIKDLKRKKTIINNNKYIILKRLVKY